MAEQEVNATFVDRIRDTLKVWFGAEETPVPKQTSEYIPDKSGGWWKIINDWYNKFIAKGGTRQEKYDRYSFLDDNLAEASTALNIYADNVVSGAIGGKENYMVVVEEGGDNLGLIESIIENTERRTEIKDQIWEMSRDMTEFGDDFEEVIVAEFEPGTFGIQKLKKLPEKEMYVNETDKGVIEDPQFPYFQKKDIYDKNIVPFDWWRCIHFKVGRGTYGVNRSLFANASQRIGRQLIWMDDSMVLARLSRAWMRYAFNIDTTGLSPEEAWVYVQKYMDQVKRKEIVDRDTGRINVYDSPPLPDEDIGIPVREGSKQGVQTLTGDTNIGNIADVRYFQAKFFMVTSVPKAYAGLEEGVRSKATLSQIDIQFARQVRRRQREMLPGLRKFYEIAFYLGGVDPTSFKWDIVFPELNTTDELIAWEMMKLKAEVAKVLMVDIGALNNQWLFVEVLGFDEEEIEDYGLIPDEDEPEENPFKTDDDEEEPEEEPTKDQKEMMKRMSKELKHKLKHSPYLRSVLEDLRDITAYKLDRNRRLSGMKPVGIGRKEPLSGNWK
jgi:hypothetical protein